MKKALLNDRLAEIASMDRGCCRDAWIKQFKEVPDRHLSTRVMRRALAHEAQVRAIAGLTAQDRRSLGVRRTTEPTKTQPALTSGTQLLREWNGRTYRVVMTDGGYELDGRTYRSLSAIAKHITGAHWSGPRFFGIT